MVRKIGLLTLPLSDNFGGILQIMALYQELVNGGYDVTFIDKQNLRSKPKKIFAWICEHLPFQDYRGFRGRYLARLRHAPLLAAAMPQRTRIVRSGRDVAAEIERLGIDTIIVGSDQVWRFEYQGDGSELNYFLDFGSNELKRISYAASFGHGSWKYPNQTVHVREQISRFDAVSVREHSGVDICKDVFDRPDAVQVLDPTILIERSYYEEMSKDVAPQMGIFCYVIDESEKIDQLLSKVENQLDLKGKVTRVSPHDISTSVPMWIRRFQDAEFIVTDSFHGVIFSILFEKRFLVVPNVDRGLDRFLTILNLLGLQDRIMERYDETEFETKIAAPIDYHAVNKRLSEARERSRKFLQESLI